MDEGYFADEVIKRYSKLIYTAIERRLGKYGFSLPQEEIMDIQQEVLISIWEGKKLDNIRNAASIPYWLAIVSGNAAIQYMRRRRRIEPEKRISLSDKMEAEGFAELASSSLSPSEELNRKDLSNKIDASLESLPAKERLIIKLNTLHDKKYEEIAHMLDIPIGTVSASIKRAREKLKAYLKEFI
jgi:RNA polymerase sigma-70 factor (ECF subfamily)